MSVEVRLEGLEALYWDRLEGGLESWARLGLGEGYELGGAKYMSPSICGGEGKKEVWAGNGEAGL